MPITPNIPAGPDRGLSRPPSPALVLWLFAAVLLLPAANSARAEESAEARRLAVLQQRYADRHNEFQADMEALAQFCEAQSFLTDADRIRQRARGANDPGVDFSDLPTEVQPAIPRELPDAQREWRVKLRKLETDYAHDLYRIARDALHQGHASLTYQLVQEVAFHDPDHRPARGMLGYVQDGTSWTTPFLRVMETRQMVDHPQFGWMPERYVARYEAGERHFNGQWMGAVKEQALRSDFNNAWEIETEHFVVKTNHSLERGVELSRALERFHDFFLKQFAAFFNSPQQMERLIEARITPRWDPGARYRVNYYRNKDEFVQALAARQPGIERANGLYMPRDRTAYFYYDEDAGEAHQETMYHEVTHQLLGESRGRPVEVGERSDFWVIEGFACYLESYNPRTQPPEIGDPNHIRIYWARRKVIEDNMYVPLRDFVALGRPQFPLDHAYYSQAAGLCHFFLHYHDGVYREAFIQYLSEVYTPDQRYRRDFSLLEQLTGVRLETLDQQYLSYLQDLPAEPPAGVQIIQSTE